MTKRRRGSRRSGRATLVAALVVGSQIVGPGPSDLRSTTSGLGPDRAHADTAATPPSGEAASDDVPVILVPGFMGSVPISRHGGNFLTNRTSGAGKLQLSKRYETLRQRLIAAGRRVVDAPFDWRLETVPHDEKADGRLDALDVDTFAPSARRWGISGLAAAMKKAGAPEVDVVAHGLGGLLIRAYLQSAAAPTADTDASPQRPRVRRLVLLGVPQEGQPEIWNPWSGNFAGMSTLHEDAPIIFPFALKWIARGNPIRGADEVFHRKDVGLGRGINHARFYQLYARGARALMPTWRFLETTAGDPIDVSRSAQARNHLLFDLNAQAPEGAWAKRVGRLGIGFGIVAEPGTPLVYRLHKGPPADDPQRPVILPGSRLRPGLAEPARPDQGWYEAIRAPNGGDGVVPLRSLVAGRPTGGSGQMVAFGQADEPPADLPEGTRWIASTGPAGHVEMLANPDVTSWVLELLSD